MINVDEIAKECEQMIGDGLDFIAPKSCCNAKKVAELVVMLRDAQKDAGRYRWLREARADWELDGEESSCIDVTLWRNDGFDNVNEGETIFGESLDIAVDEAMKCER